MILYALYYALTDWLTVCILGAELGIHMSLVDMGGGFPGLDGEEEVRVATEGSNNINIIIHPLPRINDGCVYVHS